MSNQRISVDVHELVSSFYEVLFGREPDATELSHYALIAQRAPISSMIRLILTSPQRAAYLDKRGETISARDIDLDAFIARAEARVAAISSSAQAITAYPPVTWFHSFVLSDGTKVEGIKLLSTLQAEFNAFFREVNFQGASVLDIGSFDGAFAFEAKRRGAAHVLATDYWAWTHPIHPVLERFLYVRRDLDLKVDYRLIDIPDISVSKVGEFDIVLFLGVFYHLREPITIVDRLGAITENLLIFETHLDLEEVPYPAMRHYPGSEVGYPGDTTNWWGPNRACIESLLDHAGFREVHFPPHPFTPSRGIFHARK